MKKLLIPAVLTASAFMLLISACGKPSLDTAPVSQISQNIETKTEITTAPQLTAAPTAKISPISPPTMVEIDFNAYSDLANAIASRKIVTDTDSKIAALSDEEETESLEIFNSFINKLALRKFVLPVPMFDGQPAKLHADGEDKSVLILSKDLFDLPGIWYRVERNGIEATIELTPISLVDELNLTGSETYSDIVRKLAPSYPTEETPKEQYIEHYSDVSAHDVELANGRKVRATVLVEDCYTSIRTTYRFVFNGFVVNVWSWSSHGDSVKLTDEFFKGFSLEGDIAKVGQ